MCTASTPSIACATNLLKGEEQEWWQPNNESISLKGSSPTSYKCLVANNDSGDESNEEEEYEDDSEDETKSTSSWGASSYIVLHVSAYNDYIEDEIKDVKEKELRQLYGRLNKEDKVVFLSYWEWTRNKVRHYSSWSKHSSR
jgi:hypothetical protein